MGEREREEKQKVRDCRETVMERREKEEKKKRKKMKDDGEGIGKGYGEEKERLHGKKCDRA
jgi:hypothetical protein